MAPDTVPRRSATYGARNAEELASWSRQLQAGTVQPPTHRHIVGRRPGLLWIVDVAVLTVAALFLTLGYASRHQEYGQLNLKGLHCPGLIATGLQTSVTPVPMVPLPRPRPIVGPVPQPTGSLSTFSVSLSVQVDMTRAERPGLRHPRGTAA